MRTDFRVSKRRLALSPILGFVFLACSGCGETETGTAVQDEIQQSYEDTLNASDQAAQAQRQQKKAR